MLRILPKAIALTPAGLVLVMFSPSTATDVMKRIAVLMVGGVVTSTILELIIYTAIYVIWKERELLGIARRETKV